MALPAGDVPIDVDLVVEPEVRLRRVEARDAGRRARVVPRVTEGAARDGVVRSGDGAKVVVSRLVAAVTDGARREQIVVRFRLDLASR